LTLKSLGLHAAQSVQYSADGKLLATIDTALQLWDPITGAQKANIEAHRAHITCLAFSPDGKTIATGSLDRTVKLWDVAALLKPEPEPTTPESEKPARERYDYGPKPRPRGDS
jgi:WD40 repeat protein